MDNRITQLQEGQRILRTPTQLDNMPQSNQPSSVSQQAQAPMVPQQAQAPMVPQQAQAPMAPPMMQQDINKGMRGVETLPLPRMPSDDEINKGILMALIEKRAEEAGIDVEESVRTVMNISDIEKAKSAPPSPQRGLPMSAAPAMQQAMNDPVMAAQGGGLMQLAAGGEFSGPVPGDGHGMQDNVYMPIKEGEEQVATLAVSPTEYVVDSYTMAALGNGNPDEGAEVMDEVIENVREKAYGTSKQPNEISGLAALRPMMERV